MKSSLFLKGIDTSGVSWYSKFVTIVLLLDSVLDFYGTSDTSFSAVLQAFCIVVYFCFYLRNRDLYNVPTFFVIYFVYLIAVSIIANYSFPIGYLKILLWYFVFFNAIDFRYLLKSYQSIAIVVIGFFYIQELTHAITGTRILGLIPGLPLRLTAENMSDVSGFLSNISTNTRSSSIFSEPAHFAQWLFPLLCIRLFSNEFYSLKRAFIIIVTLLLTKSGNAVFGLAAVGTFYIYHNFIRVGSMSAKIKGLSIIIVGLFAVYIYSNSSIGSEVMDRRETLSVAEEMDKGYATSSFMRIYRGYFIYADYNPVEKIFGNPSTDAMDRHINNSGISALFKEGDTYMNTVHRILTYTGLVGVLLIILMISSFWKGNTPAARALLFIWVVLSFISSGFFAGYTTVYFAFIYFMKKQNLLDYEKAGLLYQRG